MGLQLRDVVEADLPAMLSLRNRAFGPLGTSTTDWWGRVAAETLGGRWLAVVDDDGAGDLVGAGRIRPYEQVWGGRPLPMGGVAGVYVEPSARGRGVATTLTRGLITRMGELGDVVSCLYPTTVSLYRRSGYELGGVQQRTTYAGPTLRGIGSLPDDHRPRRARTEDAETIVRLVLDDAARHHRSGPMPPSVGALRGAIERDEVVTYLLPDGVVIYDHGDDALTVEHLAAASPETARALWGLVGSGSSAAPTVHTYLDPRDPLALVLAGLPTTQVRQVPWMARVIDLGAAFAGRGQPVHLTAEVGLVVDDAEAPANAGRWTLSVAGGAGTASRGDDGDSADREDSASREDSAEGSARVGARGLAALWCGWSTSRLRIAGLLTGGTPDDDAALDAVFAATPHLTEYF
ncbi:MAG: GNAT family N-acetyltransferase [Humibacillus sp.]